MERRRTDLPDAAKMGEQNICISSKLQMLLSVSSPNKTQLSTCSRRGSGLRPFFAAGHNESVPQGGVHGEDGPRVSLGHQPDEEVVLPHVDVSIDGTREREVVLPTKGHRPHRDRHRSPQRGRPPDTCSSRDTCSRVGTRMEKWERALDLTFWAKERQGSWQTVTGSTWHSTWPESPSRSDGGALASPRSSALRGGDGRAGGAPPEGVLSWLIQEVGTPTAGGPVGCVPG